MRTDTRWGVWLLVGLGAAWPLPGLGGGVMPAMPGTQSVSQAVASPPTAAATALGNGGRYVLVTVSSPGFVGGMKSGAPQLVRLDMITGETALVSRGAGGKPGNGPSGRAEMTADGRRVVFESLASDLVEGDTNGTWSVFVRDMDGGGVRRVEEGGVPPFAGGSARMPQLSADGSTVCLEEANGQYAVRVLHSLAGDPVWYLGSTSTGVVEVTFAAAAPRFVGVSKGGAGGGSTWALAWQDLAAGTGRWLATVSRLDWMGSPGISASGRYVAWCRVACDSRLATTNTVQWIDVTEGEVRDLTTRTNPPKALRIHTDRLAPAWSADERWLAYSVPEPAGWPSNAIAQIYLWNRETEDVIPITVAADGGGMGSGDSLYPVVGPDAAYVAFVSEATNLVAGGLAPGRRVFRWKRATRETSALFEGLGAVGGLSPVSSADGRHAAVAAANAEGGVVVQVVDLETGELREMVFAPELTESATGRGAVGRWGTWASADGRWLAMTSVPDSTTPVQVYLVDRLSGERTLVSRGGGWIPGIGELLAGGTFVGWRTSAFLEQRDKSGGGQDGLVGGCAGLFPVAGAVLGRESGMEDG